MKIYIAKDSSIDLKVSKIVKYLNAKCEFVKFEEMPLTFQPADELIKYPVTHKKYSQHVQSKLDSDDFIVIITQIQYDNNYFYEEKNGLIIISFFAWKYLSSLPIENGLIYFICGILMNQIMPYDAVNHDKRLGCVNDFLYKKTRVDDGMRKGKICENCKKYIQKHKLSETQSFLYQDIISMLNGLTIASGEERSVISTKQTVNGIADNFNIKTDYFPKINKNKVNSLFISYSHKDEEYRMNLETHLKVLQRRGIISIWTDRKIIAGDEWKEQIDNNLKSASIILMLISADFLASDYCYDIEMTNALKRHRSKETIVIPIILRECLWKFAEFGGLQALPPDGKPIQKFTRKDEVYTSIGRAIATILDGD